MSSSPVSNMNDTDTERLTETTRWLWRICGPLIFIPGLIGNFIAMWIFIKLKITSSKAYFHLFILAVTDTAVLFTSLGRLWIKYTFDLDVRDLSDASCKFHQFLTYTFMDFSGWILVSLSIERFISVYFPFKFKKWCTVKRAMLKLVVVFVLICAINAHMLVMYGRDNDDKCNIRHENLRQYKDWRRYDADIFVWIDLCILSFIPFVIMFTCSVLIIHRLKYPGMVQQQGTKRRKTWILLILAIVYICLSLPNSITYPVNALLPKNCSYCDVQWDLAWTGTYLILLCNYAINAIIYTKQSKEFNKEFHKLIRCQLLRRICIPRCQEKSFRTPTHMNGHHNRIQNLTSSITLSSSMGDSSFTNTCSSAGSLNHSSLGSVKPGVCNPADIHCIEVHCEAAENPATEHVTGDDGGIITRRAFESNYDNLLKRAAEQSEGKHSNNDETENSVVDTLNSVDERQNSAGETLISVDERQNSAGETLISVDERQNSAGETLSCVDKSQNSVDERQNSAGETQNSSGETLNSVDERLYSTGETQNSSGETHKSIGETQNSSDETLKSVDERLININETQNNAGEKQNSSGKTLDSIGERENSIGKTENSTGEILNSIGETENSGDETLNSIGETLNNIDETQNSAVERLNANGETLTGAGKTSKSISETEYITRL
ncbi:putative leucine-rich repeat-containing protein DDB_G0290503 [Gigantopelta aegis]|uniref:putative leucine-rich repeat-containing protein DDB_G0290503 n=1 Tax=Gigantopelta aegis TaxID=1735272 RepID=UPI001B88D1DD|nr:putative leucine-rich repeat-containing protein DDB_G0290503 [Gigantopelta aegis]